MFNVGDIVANCGIKYVVDGVYGDHVEAHRLSSGNSVGRNPARLFTLVTPAGPPPSVLTGMTQFFKDKEKSNV
jgi:hypothetical protein